MPARPARRRGGAFLALLALFIVLRGLFVAAAADVYFYAEELEKGVPAKALLDGVDVPYAELPYHRYEGGGFVVSHLKALAFLCVGPSLLAHKLVALLTSSLVLAAGYALARRHLGRRAALVLGLLFTLGPLAFQKLSLLSLGIHFEALAFVFVVLDRGLVALRAEGAPRRRDLVALGLAAGFGTYFSYQVALAAAWVVLCALVARRDLLRPRVLGVALGAFLAGFAPWLAMFSQVGGALLNIHGKELVGGGGGGLAALAALESLARDASARPPLEVARVLAFPVGAALAAVYALARGDRAARGMTLYLAGFAALWTAAWVGGGFVLPSLATFLALQRLAPLWGVGLVLVAAAAAAAARRAPAERAAVASAVWLLALVGVWNAVRVLGEGRLSAARSNLVFAAGTKGYEYRTYFAVVIARGEGALVDRARPWLALEEEPRERLLADLAAALFQKDRRGLEHVEYLAQRLEPQGRRAFLLGAGQVLARAAKRDLEAAFASLAGEPADRRAILAEALGRHGRDLMVRRESVAEEVASFAGRAGAEAFLEGVGYRVFRAFVLQPYGGPTLTAKPAAALAWLRGLNPDAAAHLEVGFRRAWDEVRIGGLASAPP